MTSINHESQKFWGLFDDLKGSGPQLNLTEVERAQYPVSARIVPATQLAKYSMAWYESDQKKGLGICEAGARPAIVGQVANELHKWPTKVFAEGVESWENKIRNGCAFGTLIAYDIPNREPLLLDGNHRAVAAVRLLLNSSEELEVLVLSGPMDLRVLPDLKHYILTDLAGVTR